MLGISHRMGHATVPRRTELVPPWLLCLLSALCAALVGVSATFAQTSFAAPTAAQEPLPPEPANTVAAPSQVMSPTAQPTATLISTGCSSCDPSSTWLGGSLPPVGLSGDCIACSGGCVPGQTPCSVCTAHTRVGRFACEIYRALCCPDPCYEPQWTPIADAAFFVEAVRPVTQQRLRWDAGLGMVYPDRAEYFWARADGHATGPSPDAPWLAVPSLDYHDLSMYTETSSGKFSFFINQSYRSVYPDAAGHGAGFAPMDLGTKTLLFDCELLQIAFQFRTFMPIGNTRKGLGNGHVSLEPSLIMGLSLSPDMYLQGQIAQWIPLGGDSDYAGAILHYHVSVNWVYWRLLPDVPVMGTLEANGYSFQDGAYTDPWLGERPASGETYVSAGPGIRMAVCDKIDFGIGTAFSLTADHFAEQLIRSEFRFRY